MIEGFFAENNLPCVSVDVIWNDVVQSVPVVLDTGFTGDIKITTEKAEQLGLKDFEIISIITADGNIVALPSSIAIVSTPTAKLFVEVIISDSLPLAGIGFLTKFGYKAIVDCKHRTVVLEKA